MLRYLVRNIRTLLRTIDAPPLSMGDESIITARVRLTDLDYNLHMNNARYLEAFEMGRLDQIARTGVLRLNMDERLVPVVGSIDVRYLHQLRYHQKYAVHTRLEGWNDRWFFVSQNMVMMHSGKLAASALVRAAFLRKNQIVRPAEILTKLGMDAEAERMPEPINNFEASENHMHRHLKAHVHYTAPSTHVPHRQVASETKRSLKH